MEILPNELLTPSRHLGPADSFENEFVILAFKEEGIGFASSLLEALKGLRIIYGREGDQQLLDGDPLERAEVLEHAWSVLSDGNFEVAVARGHHFVVAEEAHTLSALEGGLALFLEVLGPGQEVFLAVVAEHVGVGEVGERVGEAREQRVDRQEDGLLFHGAAARERQDAFSALRAVSRLVPVVFLVNVHQMQSPLLQFAGLSQLRDHSAAQLAAVATLVHFVGEHIHHFELRETEQGQQQRQEEVQGQRHPAEGLVAIRGVYKVIGPRAQEVVLICAGDPHEHHPHRVHQDFCAEVDSVAHQMSAYLSLQTAGRAVVEVEEVEEREQNKANQEAA